MDNEWLPPGEATEPLRDCTTGLYTEGKELGQFSTSSYISLLAAKLLSRFSHVRLCVTPKMAAHQAHPSLGFSRQEHWSGLPFPSPMHDSEE